MPKSTCANDECNERLNLLAKTIGRCRCERVFCAEHRMPEHHSCTFEHAAAAKLELERRLQKVVAPKLDELGRV